MKTLIIYDDLGVIFTNITGDYRKPQGIKYLEIEIPKGKKLKIDEVTGIGVNVNITPHEVIFEDIPKTELELAQERIKALEESNAEMMGLMAMQQTPTL